MLLVFLTPTCYTEKEDKSADKEVTPLKRYFAPILILVLLLFAGSSLGRLSHPAPVPETDPPAAAEDAVHPADPVESTEEASPSATEIPLTKPAPTETVQPELVPISELPSEPPHSAVSSAGAQSVSAPEPAETPAQAQTPPSNAEQSPETPTAEPDPVPETPPASSAEDLSTLAQDLLAELNKERISAGISPLVLDSDLSSVAQLRAQECTIQFGHTRPDGTAYRSAVTDAGLSYQHLGENLATGQSSAQAVIQNWDSSDGHHDNIVSEHFTKVGIGLAKNSGTPYQGYTWTVVFSD